MLIGSEVCEVYFRDVIACVKALFADPDLAQYLIVVPEKHYTLTEDGQKVRMYHDMHTGKWWWSTQVSLDKQVPTYSPAVNQLTCRFHYFRNSWKMISLAQLLFLLYYPQIRHS